MFGGDAVETDERGVADGGEGRIKDGMHEADGGRRQEESGVLIIPEPGAV
jgi:hypothetical protein